MVYIGAKNCDVPVVSVCHKNPSIWVPGKVFGIVTAQWRIYILGVPPTNQNVFKFMEFWGFFGNI